MQGWIYNKQYMKMSQNIPIFEYRDRTISRIVGGLLCLTVMLVIVIRFLENLFQNKYKTNIL